MIKVLLVDDDPVLTRSWARVLCGSGYEVWGATNVRDAELVLNLCEFDVIVLDLAMPGGWGSELLPKIKQLKRPPAVCIVSGSIDAEQVIYMHDQCNMILPKPVNGALLAKLIDKMKEKTVPSGWLCLFCKKHKLSQKESELLKLACAGLHDKLIADELNISLSTVLTYWTRIRSKTGEQSQKNVLVALLRFAMRCV